MFITRLLSGIVLVAVLLLVGILGGPVLLIFTEIISLIGLFELYRACSIKKPLQVLGYLDTIVYYAYLLYLQIKGVSISEMNSSVIIAVFIVYLIALLFAYVLTYPAYRIEDISISFFGVFYVSILLSYIYLTWEVNSYAVWLIFLCSWGCDTCAYCAGRLFGRHHMAEKLSPKKTVEGAIGGVIGAFILTLIFNLLLKDKMGIGTQEAVLLSAGAAVGALISMVGDLAASAIKRNHDIKDYGHLIPGHGGILDRFDSVIITAPIIFYTAALLF